MIDVTFEIGGKKVSPNRVRDELGKVILKQVTENIKKALSSVRCPEHGEHPRVIVKGRSMDSLNFEVHGCCQNLIDLATSKLK
jgi:hypothetical protein